MDGQLRDLLRRMDNLEKSVAVLGSSVDTLHNTPQRNVIPSVKMTIGDAYNAELGGSLPDQVVLRKFDPPYMK